MKNLLAFLVAGTFCLLAWAGGQVIALDRQTARELADPARHVRPTIVALWSTDCPHCKKNLALYAQLAQRNKRLRLVTIAAEPPWEGIVTTLDKLGVAGERYAYGNDAPEALAFALDPNWRGELPRTLLFDGHGRCKALSGAVNANEIMQLLGLDNGRR